MKEINFEYLKTIIPYFEILDESFRKVLENGFKEIAFFLESLSKEKYQKLGYPLGKSIRGFKKWQNKQIRKKFSSHPSVK